MCVECDDNRITRRSFLAGAGAILTGATTIASQTVGQQRVLTDPKIVQADVSFQSGSDTVKGFLARPKKTGRHHAVIIAHGNPGVPTDIKYTADYLARAGYVSLVYDWGSSVPMPTEERALAEWRDYIFSYDFVKREMRDVQSGIFYLRKQSF